MSRGVVDLYGLKGFRVLFPIYRSLAVASAGGLAVTAIAVVGFGGSARVAVSLAFPALACVALGLTWMLADASRALSADLQRLDTYLWELSDALVIRRAPRVVLAASIGASLFGLASAALPANVGSWALYLAGLGLAVAFGQSAVFGLEGMRAIKRIEGVLRADVASLRAAAASSNVARIRASLDNYASGSQRNPFPALRGIGLYQIATRPFYDVDEFPFLRVLEENFAVIKKELGELLAHHRARFESYRYGSVGGPGWETCALHFGRKRDAENTALCPETTRLLESIPGFYTRHTLFSMLAPGATAAPHRDDTNVTLNCHLGVVVPDGDCGIRVGGETRQWQEGRCLVFDTSYEHEVWNRTPDERVVLQVTFFRQELTEDEKRWFARFYFREEY